MRKRRSCVGELIFLILTIVILGGAWLYRNWESSQKVLPPALTINQIAVGGMTQEQALNAIALAYTTPITVYYESEVTLLLPEMVDLSLDMSATSENLDEVLDTQRNPQSFLNYAVDQILGREPPAQNVRAIANYSRERVDAFLNRMAQKYDRAPQQPVPLPESGTFRSPQKGTQLNIDASRPPLIDAILAAPPEERQVHLVVKTEPAPVASIGLLQEAINSTLEDFNGIAGIFAKNLQTGQQLCMNCDLAFAGLSTLKIGIVLNLYRIIDDVPQPEVTALISETLTESNNAAANLLLSQIGAGDPYTGALQTTDFLRSLGIQSTFLAVPYDLREDIDPPGIITPGNSNSELTTTPDPFIQTTPMEMGLLLEGLDYCANGGGFLRVLYPQQIAPRECQDILYWMGKNEINTLLGAELPEDVKFAHKHGWAGDTHADISLIYAPEGNIVLSVFLYAPEWLVWEESAPTFGAIGQLVYRFFNPE